MKRQVPALVFFFIAYILLLTSCNKEKEITDLPGGNLPAKYIDIRDSTFSPASLTTVAGTTIVFVNNTSASRKLVSHNSAFFDSVIVNSGKFFSLKKDIDGNLEFHCTERPATIGSITFTP